MHAAISAIRSTLFHNVGLPEERLREVLVGNEHERITVTVHGRPTAVLLDLDDLDALEETIAVLSASAALRALSEADAELARGEGEHQPSLAAAMQARCATA